MEAFISKRLNTNEVQFWEHIKRLNIKTFSTIAKKVKCKTSDDKILTIGADRNRFQRLLVVAIRREINLKDVLSYELSAVPLALFQSLAVFERQQRVCCLQL